MRALHFNIANRRRFRQNIFFPTVILLFLVSAGFIAGAIRMAGRHIRDSRQTAQDMRRLKQNLVQLENSAKRTTQLIEEKKKDWNLRITYANYLIKRKTFSFNDRMTFLETTLPADIQLENVNFQNGQKQIQLDLFAPSFTQVTSTYRILAPFHLNSISETEKESQYRLSLTIQYPDA